MKRRTLLAWVPTAVGVVFLAVLVLLSRQWLARERQLAGRAPTPVVTGTGTALPLIEGLLPSPEVTITPTQTAILATVPSSVLVDAAATYGVTLPPLPEAPPIPTPELIPVPSSFLIEAAAEYGIPWPPPWSGPVDRPWTMYDGYWNEEWWIPGMISNSSYFLPSPQYHYGRATFYTEGRMEATAHARGMSLDGYLDGVSLMSPANLGDVVWLRPEGQEWTGPYLVVDCAQRDDTLLILGGRDEAVEVGYRTAVRWGMLVPHRRCCWVEDLVTEHYALDRVYVFIGQFLPPADVLAQHEPFHLAPWWLARAELEEFVDSPFWFPDPAPIQGQYGQWIYYDGGERFEATHFPMPEAFWP